MLRIGSSLPSFSRRQLLLSGLYGFAAAGAATIPWPTAAASVPKRGGHFKIAIGAGATTDTLDPSTWDNAFMQSLGFAIHGQLTEIDAAGNVVGSVAQSWEPSPDAKAWRFRLRDGIHFHDGRHLTSDDVVASLNLHRGADSKSVGKSLLESVTDIRTDGNAVVAIDLSEGNADFPFILSQYTFSILPAEDGRAAWQSGIGCGSYVLQHLEPGVRAIVQRNPENWKAGRGHFDSAELFSVTDVVARMSALRSGNVDAVDRCDLKTVNRLKQDPSISVVEVEGTQHYTFPMRTDTPPFTDNNVRLALKYAIDREALVKTILFGHGFVGADHPISPANRYFAAEVKPFPYDPDKAAFYLRKSGLSSLKVSLSASDAAFAGAVDAALLYSEKAKAAGIEIDVIREPADGYWSDVWMKKSWTSSYWGGRPTEDWVLTMTYAADAAWNDTFWRNQRFNELLVAARSMLDEQKRREVYAELQRILRDDGGSVIPVFATYVFAMKSSVQHDAIAKNWDLDGMKMIERWWFA